MGELLPLPACGTSPREFGGSLPLLVQIKNTRIKVATSFRFFDMWSKHHSFLDVVNESWRQDTGLTGMNNLQVKLSRLSKRLQWWNKSVFGNVFNNVKRAEASVAQAQKDWDHNPIQVHNIYLKKCIADLTQTEKIEEEFWRQKAAIRWVNEGERNTKYFHSIVQKKRSRGRIFSIEENGALLTEPQALKESGNRFFAKLFSNDVENLTYSELNELKPLPPEVNLYELCDYPTSEDIKKALFDMNSESTAGPDGYSAAFYQKCWSIVQLDVVEAILDFFDGNIMPQSFTTTTIVLIPKVTHPKAWTDFRPISLCNVINKLISKILNDRLAKLLPLLIAPTQSGFVKDRWISDNILLAQELIHDIDQDWTHMNVALKLDMAKAYDRVQWKFLYQVLERMGFRAVD
ncbi:hypothetical protein DH2020_015206 [Rehmannia glutinosa]|uniref:Reverse transcriptase domain-containing protein n=1 Tax=Rehmannia glutinosa TaxID=99300 RepID=A0ABR0WVK6_REHGL